MPFEVKGFDTLAQHFEAIGAAAEPAGEKAVYAAAGVMADAIRKKIQSLPEENFRKLRPGEKFSGVPPKQKKDLEAALGISEFERSAFKLDVRIGFDGYGGYPTNKYPKGVPNQLLAGSIESGSEVRNKTPFVRPALQSQRTKAKKIMESTFDEEIQKVLKG